MLPPFDQRPQNPHTIVHTSNPFHLIPPRLGPSMDSTAPDFRAFYPYTPNEVKHRKRTTNAQLKTLESVFKRDTKPNGPLRVELATKLGMTARGVQVWFQNRRAKEKLKATKAKKLEATNLDLPRPPSEDDLAAVVGPAGTNRGVLGDAGGPLDSHPSSEQSSPLTASPPIPHIQVQQVSQPTWETPAGMHSLANVNLHPHRRGSLPVNALFPHYDYSPPGSRSDAFDPFVRRLSVDASLQRLASNPYAHIARAKNTALFGPRVVAPIRRPLSRPSLPQRSSASMPYPLDTRRASVGTLRVSPHTTPSPSPLSHSTTRASLPDAQLYSVSSRTLSSPLPGPLPSPNFSFGAANTPSMVSTSSGGSERNSPDSMRAFSYRDPDQDDEDSTPPTYYPASRFSSIASVATSDSSSINTSYFSEPLQYFSDCNLNVRRDSCVSGPFTSMMSNLDVNSIQENMGNGQEQGACPVQKDMEVAGAINGDLCSSAGAYALPTIGLSLDNSNDHHSGNSSVPISKLSELTFALQSHEVNGTASKLSSSTPPSMHPVVEATVDQPTDQYHLYSQDSVVSSSASQEFDSYGYNGSGSYFPENYSVAQGSGNANYLNHAFNPTNLHYRAKMHSLESVAPNAYGSYP